MVSYSDAVEAESRAAWETICWLRTHFNGVWVWIEVDALSVIKEIIARQSPLNPSVLLEDARLMVQSVKVHKISDTYHEGNRCAYFATKLVREKGSNVLICDGFPSPLYLIAQADPQV